MEEIENNRVVRASVPCVILSGGKSVRFGSNKAFAKIRGRRLIDIVVNRLQAQTSGPIVINAPSPDAYGLDNLPFVSDQFAEDNGPLAGIHAAICWAERNGYNAVITTPVDTPILPDHFVDQLIARGAPAVSVCDQKLHPAHGIWSIDQRPHLEAFIAGGSRAVRGWKSACHARETTFHLKQGVDPFWNINTPGDLYKLMEMGRAG